MCSPSDSGCSRGAARVQAENYARTAASGNGEHAKVARRVIMKLNEIAQATNSALRRLSEGDRAETLREMRILFDDLRVARDKEFRTLLEQVLKTVREEASQMRNQP